MAIAPWGVVGGGKIRTDAEEQRRLESGEHGRSLRSDWKRTPEERQICLELEKVAKDLGVESITAIAIAWIMQKAPYVFPIIGGRKVEHLEQNLEALSIRLTDEQMKRLDSIVPFEKGFPYDLMVRTSQHSFCPRTVLLTFAMYRAMGLNIHGLSWQQGTLTSGPEQGLSNLRADSSLSSSLTQPRSSVCKYLFALDHWLHRMNLEKNKCRKLYTTCALVYRCVCAPVLMRQQRVHKWTVR